MRPRAQKEEQSLRQIQNTSSLLSFLALALAISPSTTAAQDFKINKIVGSLNQPTFVTFAPGDDNDLYIAELKSTSSTSNMGRIVRYNRLTQTKSTVIDLNSPTPVTTGGDGGVVGMA